MALEILAAAPSCADLDGRAADFVSEERQVPTAADALLGRAAAAGLTPSVRLDL